MDLLADEGDGSVEARFPQRLGGGEAGHAGTGYNDGLQLSLRGSVTSCAVPNVPTPPAPGPTAATPTRAALLPAGVPCGGPRTWGGGQGSAGRGTVTDGG
ncbi:hypothetical protein GCM10022630_02430 [Thermobifida alba]